MLLPTSVGEPRALSHDGLDVFNADFLPDGKNLIFTATEAGRGTRLYVRDTAGAKARAISPEGYSLFRGTVTPDGKSVVVSGPDQRIYLYAVGGGEPTALPGLDLHAPPDPLVAGRSEPLRAGRQPAPDAGLSVRRGDRPAGPWKEVSPADAAGLAAPAASSCTPDGRVYAYSYLRDAVLPPARRRPEVG